MYLHVYIYGLMHVGFCMYHLCIYVYTHVAFEMFSVRMEVCVYV